MNDENVVVDNSNTTEEVALETTENTEETVEETTQESVEELKARLAKAEEYGRNQKIRAEKAERGTKDSIKPEQTNQSKQGISTADIYALTKANIAEEDISEVEEYARYKKLSIAEALKTTALKAILSEKQELRNTANASNTGSARRTSTKIADEVLINKASKGEMPDSSTDIERLIRARKGIK